MDRSPQRQQGGTRFIPLLTLRASISGTDVLHFRNLAAQYLALPARLMHGPAADAI
jgi:hypothetical protein